MRFIEGGPPRYRHQREGLKKILATGGRTALLFDPGMGKTAVVIDYAGILALKLPVDRPAKILVVCPLVAVDTWVTQAETFVSPQVTFWAEAIGGSIRERAETLEARGGYTPKKSQKPQKPLRGAHLSARNFHKAHALSAPHDPREGPYALQGPAFIMLIVNIESFSSRAALGSRTVADMMLNAVKRYGPDLVVVDESHKIKSPVSNTSRLLGRVGREVPRRVILTGTVMPHSPLDIYGQWRFLDPCAFSPLSQPTTPASFGRFKKRFAILGGFQGREVTGFRNLDEMQDIMSRTAIVGRKKEALDLPPTTEAVIPVHLSEREKTAYRDMQKDLVHSLTSTDQAQVTNRLTQMMRLRQITCGYLPDTGGRVHTLGASKVDTIRSLVNDSLLGEKRVVVFALFSLEIADLTEALQRKGTEVMTIKGGTPTAQRLEMRRRFGSDDPSRMVMVAQVRTMSLAVNELTTASHAVFASMSQQRDDWVQARDRLDRIGQTRPVTFWYALAPGTVDEVILKAHTERSDLEEQMMKHIHRAAPETLHEV